MFCPSLGLFLKDSATCQTSCDPLKVIPGGFMVEYLSVRSKGAPQTIIGKNIFSGLKSLTPITALCALWSLSHFTKKKIRLAYPLGVKC